MLAYLSSLSGIAIAAIIVLVIFIGTILWLNWPSEEYRQFLKEQKKYKDK